MEVWLLSSPSELRKEYNRQSFKKQLRKVLGCKCVNCGSDIGIEYHHIVPLALGGTNRLTNIVPLCNICHEKAHGATNIRQVNGLKGGRKRAPVPDNYEEILWKYMYGEIGKSECEQLLNVKGTSKLNDRPFLKEFIAKYNIVSYINKIDTYRHYSKSNHKGKLLSRVVFADGNEITKYQE